MMEHEKIYSLMMDALDGELAANHKPELEAHLRACPPCMREWQALLAIDTLFRQTPALAPAAGFTQRTLARLPRQRYRIWMISVMYAALLMGGALPMLIGFWIYNRVGAALTEPTLWQTLGQAISQIFQVAGTILSALLSGAGEFVIQQPAVVGWLLVMIGLVSLWSGMFQQLVAQPLVTQPVAVQSK
ncbi:MAG: hypothetical protein GY803_31620 [Chloroflexi bacterium]|nr:hypothetical protein [Chloroflexota bacterium]